MLMNLISNIMAGTGLALLLIGAVGLIVLGPEECEDEPHDAGELSEVSEDVH